MYHLSSQVFGASIIWAFLWLMMILITDFGGIVIALFMSGFGSIVLAVMVLIDIQKTWKPLALLAGGLVIAYCLSVIGL